jgi:death on curing protein
MATEPVWVAPSVALAIHDEQIAEHGGQAGVRDAGLLDSALNRPRQRYHYTAAPIPALAASYAYGIVRNHPFLDGNKRTGLVVAELFLELNGWTLAASDAACVLTILKLAAGELTEAALADWIDSNSQPR